MLAWKLNQNVKKNYHKLDQENIDISRKRGLNEKR